MRARVLTDARLAKLAGRFVWLDIDTERPGNAAFVASYPIDAWPTLLAIDPSSGRVLGRRAGTATAAEVERFVEDAGRALAPRRTGVSAAEVALASADRLLGERRHAEAARAYRQAIEAGGLGPASRERASEALVQAQAFAGDHASCASAAREVLPHLRSGAIEARVAAQGLACALEVRDAAGRDAHLAALERSARRALSAGGALADDRSWLYDVLSSARLARGDGGGAREIALGWLAFLEGEESRARTPAERSAFDGPMVEAAVRAGEPGRAVPELVRTQRDLPADYVPPTNLAALYLELGRAADALAAADRALALAGGPRRIRVEVLRARAQLALGDAGGARATLEGALREAAALPEAVRPAGWVAKARKLLDGLAPSAPR